MSIYHDQHVMHISYVKLSAKDRKKSLNFYQHIIGLDVLEDENNHVVMGVKNHPLIHLYFDSNLKPKTPSLGLYHFALLVPSKDEFTQVIYRLQKHNYQISGVADHGVSYAIYLDDPDGHGIEIYVDLPKEKWPYQNGQIMMYTERLNVIELFHTYPNRNIEKMHENTIMGHLHLHVDDLKKADDFYNQKLGFKTMLNYGGHALFISDQGYHHHMGLNTWQANTPLLDDHYPRLMGYGLVIPKKMYQDILFKLNIPIDSFKQTLIDPYNQVIEFIVT